LSPDSLYPAAITSCVDEPAVPPRPADGGPRDDKVKSIYINDLRAFGLDCKDTVAATARRKAEYVKQYEAATAPAWKKLVPHVSFGSKKEGE
jgi:hypothetical protein